MKRNLPIRNSPFEVRALLLLFLALTYWGGIITSLSRFQNDQERDLLIIIIAFVVIATPFWWGLSIARLSDYRKAQVSPNMACYVIFWLSTV